MKIEFRPIFYGIVAHFFTSNTEFKSFCLFYQKQKILIKKANLYIYWSIEWLQNWC